MSVHPEITQYHIDLCKTVARQMTIQIRWRQVEDMEHDALYGLYNAWNTWRGEVPFELWARKCMRWAILRYASYERNYRDKRHGVSLSEYVYDLEDSTYADIIADGIDIQKLVETRVTLVSVLSALRDELPMVRDAVLRTDSDIALARKYGRKDGNSIRQMRARFLRDFFNSVEKNVPFRSTGRDRKV